MAAQCKWINYEDEKYTCGPRSQPWKCRCQLDIPKAQELLGDLFEKREERINTVKKILSAETEKSGMTLVLGAGISIPMGMPNWTGLISKMSGYTFRHQDYASLHKSPSGEVGMVKDHQANRLERALINGDLTILDGVNVLEAAQYVWQMLNNGANSPQTTEEKLKGVILPIIDKSKTPEAFLRGSTYLAQYYIRHPEELPSDLSGIRPQIEEFHALAFPGHMAEPVWSNLDQEKLKTLIPSPPSLCQRLANLKYREEVLQDIAQDNTLCAVANLLRKPGGFRRAITYNYDMLLEEYLSGVFGVSKDKIASHTEAWTGRTGGGIIQIFHVHGCIPRSSDDFQQSRQLILSEDSYYDTERYGVYNWQNSIQSYYLNRDNCVFVGFSADDYNFRRILRQMGNRSGGDQPDHYLLLTIDPIVRDIYESVCCYYLSTEDPALKAATSPKAIWEDTCYLLKRILNMRESYWTEKHKMLPIWVTIDELPRLLLSLA